MLRGKHKASFTPHADCGDCTIAVNADKVRLTGNKLSEKNIVSILVTLVDASGNC
jgi:large subunit ribosomal protein L13